MSKIESALAKARGRVIQLDPTKGTAPGKGIVPFEQRLPVTREPDRAAARKALARMEEPGLLDAAGLAARRILNVATSNPAVLMEFSELRTKILQVALKNCTIMVTSLAKGGDCGFVASNLAAAFALDDSKTALLLDCSLGAPLFEHLTPSPGALGITDYLRSDSVKLEQVIHPIGVRRLRLIPAGRSHDRLAEYFTLSKMRELLCEVRERYPDRYVVMGARDVTDSADAHILTELADYVVFVVPYGAVTERDINEAVKTIGGKKLLGVVFSSVPTLPKERTTLLGWLTGLVPFWNRRRFRHATGK